MFDRHENQGEIVGAGRFYVPLGVGYSRSPICEKDTEPITRDDDDAHVNVAADQGFAKVDDIDHEEVASRGDLDLHPNTYPRAIDGTALRPVYFSALGLGPGLTELFVDQPPQRGTAIRIPFLFDQETEGSERGPDLFKKRF